MAMQEPAAPSTLGEKLQSVKREYLFLILIIVTSIVLFTPFEIPNKPIEPTMSLYATLMDVPEGSTVLIESDWTTSTRGESGGEMESVLRILMRRNVKFGLYSAADVQAPEVAKNMIRTLNEERTKAGDRPYERWNDWVNLGFFPNAEATANTIVANIDGWLSKRTDVTPDGMAKDVRQSPVFQKVKTIKDIPLVIVVTASATMTVAIQRMSSKVPLCGLVTGVMGPESLPYYTSGQLKGLAMGLKGVYDMESMMEYGLNYPNDETGKITSKTIAGSYPGFPGKTNFAKGKFYYPTLHATLTILILAVVVGNVGMVLARRKRP